MPANSRRIDDGKCGNVTAIVMRADLLRNGGSGAIPIESIVLWGHARNFRLRRAILALRESIRVPSIDGRYPVGYYRERGNLEHTNTCKVFLSFKELNE